MDLEKFKLPETNGIFDNSEDSKQYSSWSDKIKLFIIEIETQTRYKSSGPVDKDYERALDYCKQDLEKSIHVIIHDMSENGASWSHLGLLRRLVQENVVPDHHRGRFLLQLSDWYIWYCKKLDIEV